MVFKRAVFKCTTCTHYIAEEIELACEWVLVERFGLKVNFNAEGTVARLLKEGLVEPRQGAGGAVKYAATPVEKALEKHPIPNGNWNRASEPRTGGVAMA